MEFTQPDKICPNCHHVIPANEFVLNEDGALRLDEGNRPIRHKVAQLICETCARNAAPPAPKVRRRMRGELIEGQTSFEVPAISIT